VDPSRVMVGRQAVVLVDNVPGETTVLLLNRGLFTVYVGGPFVDGPSTGVPLAPLGSLAVPADRQWCGVADPAAQNAAQAVYRVPGGTSYSPAPSEIAAQIQASQLAAQIGAAVPVPPSAAAIGVEVGGRVPVPPSAAAIGAAVPVPPSAAAIGAAVPVPPSAVAIGAAVPVPPSAGAIASGLYTTGVRPVDGPARTAYTATVPDSGRTVDISQAQSVDIVWDWRIGVARAAGTARAWAQLRLEWLDDAGNSVQTDSFELCNTNPTTPNASSTYGVIRVPALGSKLLIVFEGTQYGAAPLQVGDSAFVGLLLSARPTDRSRYFPGGPGNGATPGPAFTGLLYGNVAPQSVAAGASSPRIVAEPFSGPMEFRYLSNGAPGNLLLFAGSVDDGNPGAFSDLIPLTSGARGRLTVAGMRSQYSAALVNTGTVATAFYFRVAASDY